MDSTVGLQRERAAREIKAKQRFKANLVIYLSVVALLAATWTGLAVAGVAMNHVTLNLVISLVVMAVWGALIARSRYSTRRDRSFTEEQIQREMTRLSS